MNLGELLDQQARERPDHTALIEGDLRLSYGELGELVDTLSHDLEALGVRPGHMVGLHHPNSILYIALTYALWRIHAVVVPIGTELKEREIRELAEAMRLSAILHADEREGGALCVCAEAGRNYTFLALDHAATPDTGGLDMAFVRFTSGTTGTRKGVVLSHESIVARIDGADRVLAITPDDVILWVLSMAHHFVVTIILYLSRGATIVILKEHLAGPILDEANRHGGTIFYGAAFHYTLLAKDKSDQMLPNLRLALSTTTACPEEIARLFQERYGLPLRQAYGIIELGLACINLLDPEGRPGAVGCPLPGFTLRLDDTDRYSTADQQQGEVLVKGPGFFDAYYDPWTPAAEATEEGWFRTGDLGQIDEDGMLSLTGRTKELINVAGLKVFPQEVERILNGHPQVADARVGSRRHPRLGEIIEAEVVLDGDPPGPGSGFLNDYCQRELASYKIPTLFRFVDTIPRTSTGKIKRH